jgi:hypothetical protein
VVGAENGSSELVPKSLRLAPAFHFTINPGGKKLMVVMVATTKKSKKTAAEDIISV